MSCAQLTGIDVVVAEVAVANAAVLVTDEAVLVDDALVELDLNLGVDCRGDQRGGQLVREEAFCFVDGVDVAEEAVALIGELFHGGVVETVEAIAQGHHADTSVGVTAKAGSECVNVGDASVGETVRGDDHTVDAVITEGLTSEVVTSIQASLQVGVATGTHAVDGVEDAVSFTNLGGLQDDSRLTRVGHDGNGVVTVEFLDEDCE